MEDFDGNMFTWKSSFDNRLTVRDPVYGPHDLH